ncbi:MAG: type III ribulose-bisphosphate carboxylase [ANME-2 cluster archaeon]|nr:type III ribulose-bisphosphate carboxylase [ANME-2 cluster archaeon]
MLKDYIDLEYKPTKRDFVCEYHLEPAQNVSFTNACSHLAGESSIDTWSDISTLNPQLAEELKPHVLFADENQQTVRVAYTQDLFELNSVPQILSAIAGNIFSMKLLNNLRLMDISFPHDVIQAFKGPKYGMQGVKELLGVMERPLIGTIVKPKVGLNSEKHAEVAYNAFLGGCDLVKDDENLTDQKFNRFHKRVELTLKAGEKAEAQTGERKMYMCNITAPTCEEMLKRARIIRDLGGEYAMIDIIPVGWSALQSLRDNNEDLGLVLHAHRCMHSAFTRNPRHGISMLVIAKLIRLIGLDQLHIGTVVGKMHGERDEVLALRDECVLKNVPASPDMHMLEQDWGSIKPVFPVASGGLEPTMVPELIKIFGKDAIMQFGGGIHGHPGGTVAGAMACRQAVDAALEGISLEEYAKTHSELKAALDTWG